jgi:hypothetical protein
MQKQIGIQDRLAHGLNLASLLVARHSQRRIKNLPELFDLLNTLSHNIRPF